MKMKSEMVIMIGTTTVSSKDAGERIVKDLLGRKLIACGQIEGPISSLYVWKHEYCREEEWKVTLKFPKAKGDAVFAAIAEMHPYENPEWTMTPATTSEEYGKWVGEQSSA